jgi:hypothetical protein
MEFEFWYITNGFFIHYWCSICPLTTIGVERDFEAMASPTDELNGVIRLALFGIMSYKHKSFTPVS